MAVNTDFSTWVEVRQIDLDAYNSYGENDKFPDDLEQVSDDEFLAALTKTMNEPSQTAHLAHFNCGRVEFIGKPPYNFALFKGLNPRRNDKYVYGHPKYRYHRSMKSFCEHVVWIVLEDVAQCGCHPCIETYCYM
ncbi:hypothetical protein D6D19_04813 [Aureobasidium pullulans]|uniref:Cryptic loci regulator 2 N-terminal domain-containing protein n=1 Tax=Aureobasidium pullulans TaxID=5580 RepID=A0A4S9A5T6_AURPU|nr:hypothetical protein D6D19_04813 [Aureobasidium pullulans]THY17819.1 hypothetical protein D6D00_08342 [Aureobasidium pullulans]